MKQGHKRCFAQLHNTATRVYSVNAHGCHTSITEIPKPLCVGMTAMYMLCGLVTSTGAMVLLLNCEWLLHSYVGILCTESFEATIDAMSMC